MKPDLAAFWQKAGAFIKKKMREPESGCGKCAVCHRVCQLLEKRRMPEED